MSLTTTYLPLSIIFKVAEGMVGDGPLPYLRVSSLHAVLSASGVWAISSSGR